MESVKKKPCVKCGMETEYGFLLINQGLTSFFSPDRMLKNIRTNIGLSLFKVPWWTRIIGVGASRYVMGYKCSSCKTLLVEYDKVYSWKEAKEHIESIYNQS